MVTRGILEMAATTCKLRDGRFLAARGPGDELRNGHDFVAGKGFIDGKTVEVTGSEGSIGEVQVIFITDIVMTSTVPLVEASIAPGAALTAMRDAGVSAVISRVDDAYYLLDAGSAWVAWKKKGNRWNPTESGIRVPEMPRRAKKGLQPYHFGPIQVDASGQDKAVLLSKHPHWIARYSAGPAACYCEKCRSAGLPGVCVVCGAEMLCASEKRTTPAKKALLRTRKS